MQRRARQVAAGAVSLAFGATLWRAISVRPTPSVSLPALVNDALPSSGVSHNVTAVLLNFRSYDTLLEIAVLLAAATVALALRDEPTAREPAGVGYIALDAFVWRLSPFLVLVAAYLLWAGSTRPGGAFQAGAVLAGAAVLLRLSGHAITAVDHRIALRGAMTFGLVIFLCVAIGTLLTGRAMLQYPADWSGALILLIEATLTVSIGVVLFSLFDNAPRARASNDASDRASDRASGPAHATNAGDASSSDNSGKRTAQRNNSRGAPT